MWNVENQSVDRHVVTNISALEFSERNKDLSRNWYWDRGGYSFWSQYILEGTNLVAFFLCPENFE